MPSVALQSDNIADQKQRRSLDSNAGLHVVQLTASRFFGGPEWQMLELAKEIADDTKTTFVSFSEGGHCQAFLDKAAEHGFDTHALACDTPHLIAATRELHDYVKRIGAHILCCNGYKANLIGLRAARKLAIPIISVSHGWTAECRKVRLYEWLDRRVIRRMDRVVCVSAAQAQKVRRAGVADEKVTVILNAIRTERFQQPHDPQYRQKLESLFTTPPAHIIGAAGRLSPEKGFDVLIDACRSLLVEDKLDLGVVLFGDGFLRDQLQQQIDTAGLTAKVILAGFTDQLDRFMPHFDIFAQSSHTEGLPCVLLEASAAGVPVVATDVGGTAEAVAHGKTGIIVPPADPPALAAAIRRLLKDDSLTSKMKTVAPPHVAAQFTFTQQAQQYRSLFAATRRPGYNPAMKPKTNA